MRHRVDVPLCGSGRSSSKGPTPRIASLHVICLVCSLRLLDQLLLWIVIDGAAYFARRLAGKAMEDDKSVEDGHSSSEYFGKIFI
jgi:hypothetical protein